MYKNEIKLINKINTLIICSSKFSESDITIEYARQVLCVDSINPTHKKWFLLNFLLQALDFRPDITPPHNATELLEYLKQI